MNFGLQITNATNFDSNEFFHIDIGDIGLVIATLIIASVTYLGMKKQLKLTRMEMQARIKPIFRFEQIKSDWYTKEKETKVVFRAHLKNTGTCPAKRVKVYFARRPNSPQLIDLIENKEKELMHNDPKDYGTIFDNNDVEVEHVERWEGNVTPFWLALWIECEYLNNAIDYNIFWLEIVSAGGNEAIRYAKWHSKEEIDEAKKHGRGGI